MKFSELKNFFRRIIFYVAYLLILIILAEILLFGLAYVSQKKMFRSWTFKKQIEKYYTKAQYEMSEFTEDRFRKDLGTSSNKKSILVFGCSHLFGAGLEENQTFSYKLSKATNRPVYNRAYWAWAPQHMLYILQTQKWIKGIKEPEYIITMFIPDYDERFYLHQGWPFDSGVYLRYKIDRQNNLKRLPTERYPWYWRLFITKYTQYFIQNNIEKPNKDYSNRLYVRMMQESMNLIKSKYPNTKVLLFLYKGDFATDNPNTKIMQNKDFFNDEPFSQNSLNELEKMGYIIVNLETIVNHSLETREYKIDGDPTHPNEKVWDEVIPILQKKFNM